MLLWLCVFFLICFVVCACVPVGVVGCVFVFVVCVLSRVYLCNELWWTLLWTDLWCVYYMWFGLWFGWLAGSGRLYAFDLVEFVYYNFIIIYCYLCYK